MKLLLSGILSIAGGAILSASPITSLVNPAAGLLGTPVATSVPEPSTIAMIACGSALVMASRLRKRA